MTGTDARKAVISAEHLLKELERGRDIVLLEIGRESAHLLAASERLPGAHYVDLPTELAGARYPGSGTYPLPSEEAVQRQVRRWGINDGSVVVVHTRADPPLATRAWWILTWAGVPDVRYLDGGVDAWVSAGGRLSGEEPAEASGGFTVTAGSLPTLDAEGAARLARSGKLLDARPAGAYTGEKGGGHIPGALNLPSAANLGADGRLKGQDELREQYAALGIKRGTEVGVYCGGGIGATFDILTLSMIGISAKLYPGSWSEWSSDSSRPVMSGDGPG
ncbi:sulfurtransferase [Streptomyces sp. JH14]|uniref:sulfurtransferase n=1 Tax=Streptomyces sp. JH14 TaxID=2793630 RepID=UPI0023F742AF|nr:rhodanese-like domain-containing protein [Streptomyces sp. JH14]MDF6045920.1 sulfurtransferase [Streptomyces sp. JH14]